MLFSIIVPIYNVEKYLNKCVNSLINQTYRDIEIILVDDGSPDECPKLCDQYKANDCRIKVIHKENGGLSDARNAGLAIAEGEYILFVDSDDYIETNTCERFAKFTKEKYDIIVGRAVCEGGDELRFVESSDKTYTGKEFLLKSFNSNVMNAAAWLNVYKKQFLIDNDLYFKVGVVHEDTQFTPRAFVWAQSVLCTDIVFYHYVYRSGSISHKKDKTRNLQDVYSICMELESFFEKNTNGELQRLLYDYEVYLYLGTYQNAQKFIRGKEYVHKDFVRRNSTQPKTKLKKTLFCFSPWLFWIVSRVFICLRKMLRRMKKVC